MPFDGQGAALLVPLVVALRHRGGRRFRGGVGRRLVVLFSFIAAILVINAAVVHRYVRVGDRNDSFFQVAARQRFLTQRLSFFAEQSLGGQFQARQPLQDAVESYEQSLEVLETGGFFESYAIAPAPEAIGKTVGQVRETWNEVRPLLQRTVLAAPSTADAGVREEIRESLARLSDGSFQIVLALEEWRYSLRRQLLYLVGAASLAGLAALVTWFKLAWDHLVAPVRRLRDHAIRVAEREPVDVPPNEIEAVAQAVTELSTDMGKLRRERARMRQELRRAEADYQSIFDNAVAGILRFDSSGSIRMANRALARILGFDSVEDLMSGIEDVHGQLFADPNHRARFEELHRRRGHVELETKARRKDGSTLWVLESASVGEDRDGMQVYETVIVDITPMKKAQDSLRQLSGLLLRSQDRERRRIARELHDSTGQLLAALEMNLGRLDDVVPIFQETLASSVELASECTRQIRSMSYLLHPPMLEELGLLYALRDYTRGFSQRSGIRVELESPPELKRLDTEAELALFRVVQEALANIQRHSQSRDAVVRILTPPGWIGLEVEDHGRGIDPELLGAHGEPSFANMGVGMRGMEERLRQLGGEVRIDSRKGCTIVRARLPQPLGVGPAAGEPRPRTLDTTIR